MTTGLSEAPKCRQRFWLCIDGFWGQEGSPLSSDSQGMVLARGSRLRRATLSSLCTPHWLGLAVTCTASRDSLNLLPERSMDAALPTTALTAHCFLQPRGSQSYLDIPRELRSPSDRNSSLPECCFTWPLHVLLPPPETLPVLKSLGQHLPGDPPPV